MKYLSMGYPNYFPIGKEFLELLYGSLCGSSLIYIILFYVTFLTGVSYVTFLVQGLFKRN